MDLDKLLKASNKILGAIEKTLLTPLSWIYGAGVWLRQVGFNTGLLKQEEFDVPVVTIGNVTVGGTGKTPHVEYIVSRLCRKYEIAVLSRGYKRHTKGFVLASDNLSPVDLGDEPYQIYRKFRGMVTVAVCEDRRQGIKNLLRINPEINLVILDDAMQHRYVKPRVSVVMIDYNRPPYEDKLLPLGSLREPADRILKCDMVVVTKCPDEV
ncbi:MAG: tetraacyldisaccharide 4'-kinase, partial [Muribaculaceae bacterium]|nr:tetraacyldisaccharide 4'-kinase [Muribaculaceae bacterium]